MNTRQAVAIRIQQLCAENGYNINSLARKAAVPPTTVKSIIYGTSNNPGIVTIKLLCDGLGITLYDFFDTPLFREMGMEEIE
jgi:transcriptional regulator with XRE-family HTH domain